MEAAANRIHAIFWGRDLDELLEPVPDCGNLKYLTKERTLSLRVGLSYPADVLLVREDYDVTYNDILSYKQDPWIGGIVVTGQPGTGKTCFLYYLLLRLLNQKQLVAFQMQSEFFLFDGNGATLYEDNPSSGRCIPPGTWALSDSNCLYKLPCPAFLAASRGKNVVIVQSTSPSQISERWVKERSAIIHWVNLLTLHEIEALGTILDLDLKGLVKNYKLWGPSARTCISLLNPKMLKQYETAVTSLADTFISKFSQFRNLDLLWQDQLASHRLIVVEPTNDSRQTPTVNIATYHLIGFVSRAYANQDSATRYSLYTAISRHPWFAAPAGHIFETSVLLWLRHSAIDEHILCIAAEQGSPDLRIPSCRDRMQFFHKLSDLKDADKYDLHERAMCLVPAVQTFPTLDAIILTNEFVITVQATVAFKHDAKDGGFEKVYEHGLPKAFSNTRTRCHVFLTDTEPKVASLRTQALANLTNIKNKKIHVYSAFIDIDRFDSTLTGERVCKLQEDKGEAEEMDVDMSVEGVSGEMFTR